MADPTEENKPTPPESTPATDTPPEPPAPPAPAPKKAPLNPVIPVKPSEFGRAQHQFSSYNVVIPSGMGKEDLERGELWDHVAAQLQMYDEVRAVSNDGSFVATLIVTFRHANKVLLAVTSFTQLERVGFEEQAGLNRYEVKQRGPKKWSIIDTKDGSIIEEMIPKQAEAYKKLEEFLSIINR